MKRLIPLATHGLSGLAASLCMCMAGAMAADGPADFTITVSELLNHHWQHELVTYPFTAEEGACRVDSPSVAGARSACRREILAGNSDGKDRVATF